MKHIIETVIEIYEILLIWWVDPQYPWSQGIGSPIWGSSMTRVKQLDGYYIQYNLVTALGWSVNYSRNYAVYLHKRRQAFIVIHQSPLILWPSDILQ